MNLMPLYSDGLWLAVKLIPPFKPFLIGLSVVLPLMVISALVGFKYRKQITQVKNKLPYIYIILGSGIVINGIFIIISKKGFGYIEIGIGFILLFYGIKQRTKAHSQLTPQSSHRGHQSHAV